MCCLFIKIITIYLCTLRPHKQILIHQMFDPKLHNYSQKFYLGTVNEEYFSHTLPLRSLPRFDGKVDRVVERLPI